MIHPSDRHGLTRRGFLGWCSKGMALFALRPFPRALEARNSAAVLNDIFWVKGVPSLPFYLGPGQKYHAGIDSLLTLMGRRGLKFYRSSSAGTLSGTSGLINADDVVLIKVNAQWKYRGATNSDVVRGLIQRILAHPDGFSGEVVIFENGQGRGSLSCSNTGNGYPDGTVQANANDPNHSFNYVVDTVFNDPRVSTFLLDDVASNFIAADDHLNNGYRIFENVSYPCFTTVHGKRVELREGLWNGAAYTGNLKLINVPVLKHHDTGGSEITASLKHVYGILSMADGGSDFRHYGGLGETIGKMMVSVRTPVLNILDAIWVSQASLTGYPVSATTRSNQLLASQDPVALDYWAAKNVLYPIDNNLRHRPDFSGIDAWLTSARDIINSRGGLADSGQGIVVGSVTKTETEMRAFSQRVTLAAKADMIGSWDAQGVMSRNSDSGAWVRLASPAQSVAAGDLDGDGLDDLLGIWPAQAGVWGKSSSTGAWSYFASPAKAIAAGDMNGDGRCDLLGTWDGQGVYYRDSITGAWVLMASPATAIAAGDLDGDGKDDLVGIWPGQGGVWVKWSRDSSWSMLASSADWIAVGDMNGDGRVDLVGSWAGSGVFYRDSLTGSWVQIATPAAALAVGDLDGDGVDDLLGLWPAQGGVWVKYSKTGSWAQLSSTPTILTTGRMRAVQGPGFAAGQGISAPGWGLGEGPSRLAGFRDFSANGPGGRNFVHQKQTGLVPLEKNENMARIPGPGEPGFRWTAQKNLRPGDRE